MAVIADVLAILILSFQNNWCFKIIPYLF